ncbi:MAG: ATP-binding protein, partial [Bacteroidota bacterium]
AVILSFAETSTYIISSYFWKEDFYQRLYSKSTAVAKLLIDVEGVNPGLLKIVEKNNLSLLPYEEIRIYDFRKRLIFANRDSLVLKVTPQLIDRIRVEKKLRFSQGNYTISCLLYTGRFDRIVVVAGAIDVYGMKKLHTLRDILVAVLLFSLLIAYFSGKIYVNRALQPILEVIGQVETINEKSLHIRVDEGNGTDEIARLATTFNEMLDRLEKAFKLQDKFIANASHELRTPLAYILGQMEVSLQRERQPEDYKKTIHNVIGDLKNLIESTNKLLLLASATADSPDIPFTPLRIDDILWDARTEVMKKNPAYKIEIELIGIGDDGNELEVVGNDQLLKVAILNLMENACKYAFNMSAQAELKVEKEGLQIRIKNKGIGIDPNDLALIFEPFFRARNSYGIQGHGLGLSLVRQIIQLHKGSVSCESVLGQETIFTVIIPGMKI